MTKIFSDLADPQIAQLLNQGMIGVVPTDTVYGLVARAQSRGAVERLYSLKPRELAPGTMIGASINQLASVGLEVSNLNKIDHLWPSSTSVVIDAQSSPQFLRHNRTALPVRIPDYPEITKLAEQTGPLMTTSANPAAAPTSTSIQMAIDYFGDTVDFYVDGGDLSGRAPSTIIGFDENGEVIVYRQGSVEVDKDLLSKKQQSTGVG